MTVIPDRLHALDDLHLDRSSHQTFDDGHCALEVVAWLGGRDVGCPVSARQVFARAGRRSR